MVRKIWTSTICHEPDLDFYNNLVNIRNKYVVWDKQVYGHSDTNLNKARCRLNLASKNFKDEPSVEIDILRTMHIVNTDFGIELEKKFGHKNRVFNGKNLVILILNLFHLSAKLREKNNMIFSLLDDSNNIIEDKQGLKYLVDSHFDSLFTNTNPDPDRIRRFMEFSVL